MSLQDMNGEDASLSSIRDPIEYVKETEAYCFIYERFAEYYVDGLVAVATKELTPKPKSYKLPDIVVPIIDEIITAAFDSGSQSELPEVCRGYIPFAPVPSVQYDMSSESFSGWPRISEFNIKLGIEKLEEYIESWSRSKEWMCCVEFLGFESEENSNYFVYEVEFSMPTPTYPIPQATASVYFSLEVSKMVPLAHDRCIEVSYVFESSNVIHYPGKIDFQENWIISIIHCKINFFRSLLF